MNKKDTKGVTAEKDEFTIGKANIIKKGKDLTIIACGVMVYHAVLAEEMLKKTGIDAGIINLHTVKPIDTKAIVDAASTTGAIVTAEEHLLAGGMGSAICEVLAQESPVPVEMVGVRDRFGESGSPWDLMEQFHLMPGDIVDAAKKVRGRVPRGQVLS